MTNRKLRNIVRAACVRARAPVMHSSVKSLPRPVGNQKRYEIVAAAAAAVIGYGRIVMMV